MSRRVLLSCSSLLLFAKRPTPARRLLRHLCQAAYPFDVSSGWEVKNSTSSFSNLVAHPVAYYLLFQHAPQKHRSDPFLTFQVAAKTLQCIVDLGGQRRTKGSETDLFRGNGFEKLPANSIRLDPAFSLTSPFLSKATQSNTSCFCALSRIEVLQRQLSVSEELGGKQLGQGDGTWESESEDTTGSWPYC